VKQINQTAMFVYREENPETFVIQVGRGIVISVRMTNADIAALRTALQSPQTWPLKEEGKTP
jgi:hypothetical protein